jgi:hypothetical protein
VQDVADEGAARLSGAPAGGSTSTTTLADHLDAWLTEQQHRATVGDAPSELSSATYRPLS